MTLESESEWNKLDYKEKNRQLFLRQKKLLSEFVAHGAISQAQFDTSFHDLMCKMGFDENGEPLQDKRE